MLTADCTSSVFRLVYVVEPTSPVRHLDFMYWACTGRVGNFLANEKCCGLRIMLYFISL